VLEYHRSKRTAMTRSELSTPAQWLRSRGHLDGSKTVFDYGCGRGGDIERMLELGIDAKGWDPNFCPKNPCLLADIVQVAFVLNVIEEDKDRVQCLKRASALAKELLVIAMIQDGTGADDRNRSQGDGGITSSGSFQWYASDREVLDLVRRSTGRQAWPHGGGLYTVDMTKDPAVKLVEAELVKGELVPEVSKQHQVNGQFKKGRSKTGGRPPGSPNHVTQAVKDAVYAAFEEAGGIEYLVEVSRLEPKTFVSLLSKLIPSELRVETDDGLPLVIVKDYTQGMPKKKKPRPPKKPKPY